MKLLKPLLLLLMIVAVSALKLQAQDIHFTQYYMSPYTLNPALAGAYEGTFRIGGIYRDQWSSFVSNGYRTPDIYVDAPIINGFRGKGKDWVGVGFNILNDQVGELSYSNVNASLGAAYHTLVGETGKTRLSLGAQVGMVQKNFDPATLRFGDQWDGKGTWTKPSADANVNDNANYTDLSAGVGVATAFGEADKVRLNFGVSGFHLNRPKDGFAEQTTLDPLLVGHLNADVDLSEKLVLSPGFLFQSISGATQSNAMLMLGYRLKPDLLVQYGQGFRFGDATNVILGLQYNRLRVGMSYDINVSDLNTISNSRGGFELAASYIARIFKDPKIKPVILCPGF